MTEDPIARYEAMYTRWDVEKALDAARMATADTTEQPVPRRGRRMAERITFWSAVALLSACAGAIGFGDFTAAGILAAVGVQFAALSLLMHRWAA